MSSDVFTCGHISRGDQFEKDIFFFETTVLSNYGSWRDYTSYIFYKKPPARQDTIILLFRRLDEGHPNFGTSFIIYSLGIRFVKYYPHRVITWSWSIAVPFRETESNVVYFSKRSITRDMDTTWLHIIIRVHHLSCRPSATCDYVILYREWLRAFFFFFISVYRTVFLWGIFLGFKIRSPIVHRFPWMHITSPIEYVKTVLYSRYNIIICCEPRSTHTIYSQPNGPNCDLLPVSLQYKIPIYIYMCTFHALISLPSA